MDAVRIHKLFERYEIFFKVVTLVLALIASVTSWEFEVLREPERWGWPQWAIATLMLVAVIVLLRRLLRGRASRLLDPDALRLDPQLPDQLVGRAEDLKKLSKLLGNPLVFLISESGCGKTALLRAGVEQDPQFTSKYLPIYIDMSALDWEKGPLRELRDGFARALPADDPARNNLKQESEPPGSEPPDYVSTFRNYNIRCNLRPLLLLDQFDDYQAQSLLHDRFLPPETQQFRTAEEIAKENTFWRVVGDCLEARVLHVVVAVRNEACPGLDCVRFFHPTPQYIMSRLESGFVGQIVDRLTQRAEGQRAVVADPNDGWTDLRERLAYDLQSTILPQQLKIALSGLRTLRELTVRSYVRAGGIAGLEAAFVRDAMERAASASGLHDDEVLRLAGALVDRDRQPEDRLPPQSLAVLAKNSALPNKVVKNALEALASDKIARPEGGTAGAEPAWRLDHAYLARPILRLERDRVRWRLLLKERARTHADSDWPHRWQTLLPLNEQLWLIVARLRGRFHYDEYRQFALKSLLRGVPVIALIIVGYFGWGQYRVLLSKHDLTEWGLPVALYDQSRQLTSLSVSNDTLTNLRWLRCSFYHLSLSIPKVNDLGDLRSCKSIVSLDLRFRAGGGRYGVTDLDVLKGLTGLTSLSLDLDGSGITDLDALKGLTGLTSLSLDLSGGGRTDLDALKGLTGLTSLSLERGSRITDVGPFGITDLDALKHLTGLTSLSLDLSGGITDLDALKHLTGLTSLSLKLGGGITDLDALKGLTGLTSLSLKLSGGITDLDALKGLTGLTSLSLGFGYGVTDLDALKQLTGLTSLSLDLGGSWITNLDDLKHLTGLTSLSLDLGDSRITDLDALKHLTGLTSLSLVLSGSNITDLGALKHLTGLTSLSLERFYGLVQSGTILSFDLDDGITNLDALNGLTGLTNLSLVGITGLDALKGFTGLTSLRLGQIGGSLDALKGLTRLTTLSLNINGSGITDLDALKGLTGLTSLMLTLAGANSIANLNALKGLTGLTSLTLNLGDSTASLNPLKDLTGLTSLTLNFFESRAVDLQSLDKLQTLTINSPHFELSAVPKSLRRLDLSDQRD